jgi:uncharacterized protein YkwD
MIRTWLATSVLLFPIASFADDRTEGKGFVLTEEEKAVLDLTNAQRRAAGLPELVANERLFQAARAHSANMARQCRLDHVLDGRDMSWRVRSAGYAFRAAGENIAWNARDAGAALRIWMSSDGHRANILNQQFTEIGVAVAINERGERYWTQVFARPE